MNFSLSAELLEATRLTKAGQLTEATAALQRMLRAGSPVTRLAGPGHDGPQNNDAVGSPENNQLRLAPPDNRTSGNRHGRLGLSNQRIS